MRALDFIFKVRGTPEYFESLKKSQAVAEEKEKLLVQVCETLGGHSELN